MPLYEFKCPICGDTTEKMQKHSDKAPLCEKPECAEQVMSRCISPSNFSLKGGGWAKDGYSG